MLEINARPQHVFEAITQLWINLFLTDDCTYNSRGLFAIDHLDEDETPEGLPALEDGRRGQRGAEQRH